MNLNRWNRRAAVRTLTVGLIGVTLSATGLMAAQAHHAGSLPWHNETDMVNDLVVANRATMILDPGRGSRLSRAHVLARSFRYEGRGFDRNFLWYAPQRVMTVSSDASWATCIGTRASDGWCNTIDAGASQTIGSTFGGDTALTVLEYGGAFIGLAGGNWRTNVPLPVPVPRLVGHKFHDRDGDGVRDAGEPGLSGWTFQLVRQQSFVGQPVGSVRTTQSDSSGTYGFDLYGYGPGVYYVQEIDRPGWERTTALRQSVTVTEGIGAAALPLGDFGAVESKADAVTVDFALVDPPSRLDVNESATFTVRSVLENRGPAGAVDVQHDVDLAAPADCVVDPATHSSRIVLSQAEPVTVDTPFSVVCTEPGAHPLTFSSDLTILMPGVTDPEPANNAAVLGHVAAVFAATDVSVTAATLECATKQEADVAFDCVVTGTVSTGGPHAPTTVTTETALNGPVGCAAEPTSAAVRRGVPLSAPAAGAAVETTYRVTCSERGSHRLTASVRAAVDQSHVEEVAPGDEEMTASDEVEVLQGADLVAGEMSLVCMERASAHSDTQCAVRLPVTNNGPAERVQALVRLEATPPARCTLSSVDPSTVALVVGVGETQAVTRTWRLSCPGAKDRGSVLVNGDVRIAAGDTYAQDRSLANNEASLLWLPVDPKKGAAVTAKGVAVTATASAAPAKKDATKKNATKETAATQPAPKGKTR